MWLVKQAASKVKTLSQQVLKEKSEAVKLAEDIVSNRHQVMPLRKMADLATLSFDIDAFNDTLDFITTKLNDLKFERKSLKKRLNVLVLATYLIKHGASGFIDQFRALNEQFRRYETLRNFIAEQDRQMVATMADIRDRASYILTLLGDKAALLRQKAVARLVREKLFIQGGDFTSHKQQQQQQSHNLSARDKVQQFLEHYVWRYTQKLDKKLDEVADILIAKIDEYLDGEIPENFEIDETEGIASKPSFTKSEFELGGQTAISEEIKFVETKLQLKQENVDHDWLELAEVQKQELTEVQKQGKADLLVFEQTDESTKENQPLSSNKQPAAQLEEKGKQLKDMDDDEIEAFRKELLTEQSKLQSN